MQLSLEYLNAFLIWSIVAIAGIIGAFVFVKYIVASSNTLYVKSYALQIYDEIGGAVASPDGSTIAIPTTFKGLPSDAHVYIIETQSLRVLVINATYKTMLGHTVRKVYTFPILGVFATNYDPVSGKYFPVLSTVVEPVNKGYTYCAVSPFSNYEVCGDAIKKSYSPLIKYNSTSLSNPKWVIEIPKGYIIVKKVDGVLVITGYGNVTKNS